MPAMRHESSITSLSWIPSEAIGLPASRFPRHWVYDHTGSLSHKSELDREALQELSHGHRRTRPE
jgi:hypothetical protein